MNGSVVIASPSNRHTPVTLRATGLVMALQSLRHKPVTAPGHIGACPGSAGKRRVKWLVSASRGDVKKASWPRKESVTKTRQTGGGETASVWAVLAALSRP